MNNDVVKRVLEILVCPLCKGKLHYDRNAQELICYFDKLAYPIKDGIPVMMEEEARDLNGDQSNNRQK